MKVWELGENFMNRECNQNQQQDLDGDEGWIEYNGTDEPVIKGDIVRFTEPVWREWGDDNIGPKGLRTNIVRITHETCSKNLQQRKYFEVIDSWGKDPLPKNEKSYRLCKKLNGFEKHRRVWADEQQRLDEKAISDQLYEDARRKQAKQRKEFADSLDQS